MKRKDAPSLFEVVRQAVEAGEDIDDAELYRRAGLNPADFYQGEEAVRRRDVGLKCMLGQRLTPEEDLIRQDILRVLDKGLREKSRPERVGGKWAGVDEKAKAARARKAETDRGQATRAGRKP